jgi:hypothetical protein
MNLAIMNADDISAHSEKWEVLHATCQVTRLSQFTAGYDQLIYPFIFWNGKGDCRIIRLKS